MRYTWCCGGGSFGNGVTSICLCSYCIMSFPKDDKYRTEYPPIVVHLQDLLIPMYQKTVFLKEKKANQQQQLGRLQESQAKHTKSELSSISQKSPKYHLLLAQSPDQRDSGLSPELHGIEAPTIRLSDLTMTVPSLYSGFPVLTYSPSYGNSQLQDTCYMPGNERGWV